MQEPLIEIVLIVYSFSESPFLGIIVLGYILNNKGRLQKLENQLKDKNLSLRVLREQLGIKKEDEEKLVRELEKDMALRFYPYKGCVVEQFKDRFRIMFPNGKKDKHIFRSFNRAKEKIDLVAPKNAKDY